MKAVVNAVSRGLPEVSVPLLRVSGLEKSIYTALAVAVYVWGTQVRLYGVRADSTADPLYIVNAPLGASGGSIMSLGVLPVILAEFFAQIGFGCGRQGHHRHSARGHRPSGFPQQAPLRRIVQGPAPAVQLVFEAIERRLHCSLCL
jgi:hypothetical protein